MANAYSLGIDIGNSQTKIVLLESGVKPILVDTFIFPSSFETGQTSFRRIDGKVFADEFTRLVPATKLRNCRIAVNLPPGSITAMSLFLPVMGKKELASAAINEAKRKMIPAYGPNHTFETLALGERIVSKIPRYEVLVVRTDVLYINELIEMFNKNLDMTPIFIAASSFAFPLLPFFRNQPLDKDADLALVEIGWNSLCIAIFRDEKLSFFRNTVYGMQDIIQDLAARLGFPDGKTDEIIREKGVPEVNFNLKDKVAVAEEIMRQKYEEGLKSQENGGQEDINLLELRMLWQAHIDRILHEFRRSLAYYKEQSGGRQVGVITFAGGGCHVQNLVKIVTEQIGGQCVSVRPFEGIHVPEEKAKDQNMLGPIFTGAASLALSGIQKGRAAELLNFLPQDLRRKESAAKKRLIVLLILICMIAAFGFLSLELFLSNYMTGNKISTIETELKRFKQVSSQLKELSQRELVFGQRLNQVETIALKNKYVLQPLSEMPKIIPSEVYLTNLNITDGEVELSARIFADYEKTLKEIDEFQQNLKTIPFMSNVALKPLKTDRISPQPSADGEGILLDMPRERDFTVTAELGGN